MSWILPGTKPIDTPPTPEKLKGRYEGVAESVASDFASHQRESFKKNFFAAWHCYAACAYHVSRMQSLTDEIMLTVAERRRQTGQLNEAAEIEWEVRLDEVAHVYYELGAFLASGRTFLDKVILLSQVGYADASWGGGLMEFIRGHEQKTLPVLVPGAADLIARDWHSWAKLFREYRDCLIHYKQFVRLDGPHVRTAGNNYQTRLLIPRNPKPLAGEEFRFEPPLDAKGYAYGALLNMGTLMGALLSKIEECWKKP